MRPASVFSAVSKPSGYFGVHPFVEQHPEAVFIMRTHVDYKTNSEACKNAGLDFGRSVFVPMDDTGTPVTHDIATKPNLTGHRPIDRSRGLTLEDTMGIATDPFFIEGLFESLKELGVPGNKMHTRDVNGDRVAEPRGYVAMGERVGATVAGKTQIATADDANDAGKFTWKDVSGGVVYRQNPVHLAVQCAGLMEPECSEIQGSHHGPHADLQELAGLQCIPLCGVLRQMAGCRQDADLREGNQQGVHQSEGP